MGMGKVPNIPVKRQDASDSGESDDSDSDLLGALHWDRSKRQPNKLDQTITHDLERLETPDHCARCICIRCSSASSLRAHVQDAKSRVFMNGVVGVVDDNSQQSAYDLASDEVSLLSLEGQCDGSIVKRQRTNKEPEELGELDSRLLSMLRKLEKAPRDIVDQFGSNNDGMAHICTTLCSLVPHTPANWRTFRVVTKIIAHVLGSPDLSTRDQTVCILLEHHVLDHLALHWLAANNGDQTSASSANSATPTVPATNSSQDTCWQQTLWHSLVLLDLFLKSGTELRSKIRQRLWDMHLCSRLHTISKSSDLPATHCCLALDILARAYCGCEMGDSVAPRVAFDPVPCMVTAMGLIHTCASLQSHDATESTTTTIAETPPPSTPTKENSKRPTRRAQGRFKKTIAALRPKPGPKNSNALTQNSADSPHQNLSEPFVEHAVESEKRKRTNNESLQCLETAKQAYNKLKEGLLAQWQQLYEPLLPPFKEKLSQLNKLPTGCKPSLSPPAQFFADLGVGPSNEAVILALASNKVVRFQLADLRWTEDVSFRNLLNHCSFGTQTQTSNEKTQKPAPTTKAAPSTRASHGAPPPLPKSKSKKKDMHSDENLAEGASVRLSTLLHCTDGFVREYWVTPEEATQFERFYMRDVPTPETWRDKIMEMLPSFAHQAGIFDFRRYVPLSERGDNHDLYFGVGRFAAGLHVDEGKLMGLNGCVRGVNSWYFVSPHVTQEFEKCVIEMMDECDVVWAKHQPVIMTDSQFENLLALFPNLQGHVFKVKQQRGDFLMFPSGWGHQVVTEGPPTMKVAWALLPYLALPDALSAIDEYRQNRRVLVDNAGKAIVSGAKAICDAYRADELVHYMTIKTLVECMTKLCAKFDEKHEQKFVFTPNVMDFVGSSPYCADCQTPYFSFFSCEHATRGEKVNRCYECTISLLGPHLTADVRRTLTLKAKRRTRLFYLHAEAEHARGSPRRVLKQLQTILQHGSIILESWRQQPGHTNAHLFWFQQAETLALGI